MPSWLRLARDRYRVWTQLVLMLAIIAVSFALHPIAELGSSVLLLGALALQILLLLAIIELA